MFVWAASSFLFMLPTPFLDVFAHHHQIYFLVLALRKGSEKKKKNHADDLTRKFRAS